MSASTPSCQSGRRPDAAGEAAHPVGERAGAGVDEPGGQRIPRGEAGDAGVGQAGAQAVLEPAVELDEPGHEAGDALVALAIAIARRLAGGSVVRVDRAVARGVTRRHLRPRLGRQIAS